MEVSVRRDTDIARASVLADDRQRGQRIKRLAERAHLPPSGFFRRAEIFPIAPREVTLHTAEAEFPAHHLRTHEMPALPGAIDQVVIHGKAALLDDRAHLGKARILVPSAALVEPRERDERKREDQDLKATGGHREMTNDGWRTEDK